MPHPDASAAAPPARILPLSARVRAMLSRIAPAWLGRPAPLLADALAPLGRLQLAERFQAPPYFVAVRVPGTADLVGPAPGGLLLFLISPGDAGPSWRHVRLQREAFDGDGVSLGFTPLEPGPAGVALIAIAATSPDGDADLSRAQADMICQAMAAGSLAQRPPIQIPCNDAVPGYTTAANAGHTSQAMRVLPAALASLPPAPPPPPPQAAWALERSWQEGGDTYVEGWIHAFSRRITAIRFEWDADSVTVSAPHTRADLLPHYPMLPDGAAQTGFATLLPGFRGPLLAAVLDTDEGPVRAAIPVPSPTPSPDDPAERGRAREAELQFITEVNTRRLELIELGGRIVGPWTESRRPTFAGAARFVGFDIHPAEGVDVVGDAHQLSNLVGRASFDAVMSTAVLEHLAMPWIVAAEINRTLRPGGLSYHVTVQSWPVHEQPNDFWRFTDEALALLFGPLHGFEVLGAGMSQRIRMYPEDRAANDPRMGLHPGYGLSWVLSRKVEDLPDAGRPITEALDVLSRRYPSHATPSPLPSTS